MLLLRKKYGALKTELEKISGLHVDRYKGEFERDEDWNPKFPCALIRFDEHTPSGRNMDGAAIKDRVEATLYIGARDAEEPSVLDTLEAIENACNGATIKFTVTEGETETDYWMKVKLSDGGARLFGYSTQVEIYSLKIQIE